MVRVVLSSIAGFVAWLLLWFAGEAFFSSIGPDWYGVHQQAFESALIEGGEFSANTTLLLIQIVLASAASMISGWLAAMLSRENKRAPLLLGVLLLVLGLMKVVMSWSYVPIWHHVVFLALLIPLTLKGGQIKSFQAID